MEPIVYVDKIVTTAKSADNVSNASTIGSDDNNRIDLVESKSRMQADSLTSMQSASQQHDVSVDFHDSLDENDDSADDALSDDDNRSDVSGSSTSTESLIERSRKFLTDEAGIIILKTRKLPKTQENFDLILNFDIDGTNRQQQKARIEHLHQQAIEGGQQFDNKQYLDNLNKLSIEGGSGTTGAGAANWGAAPTGVLISGAGSNLRGPGLTVSASGSGTIPVRDINVNVISDPNFGRNLKVASSGTTAGAPGATPGSGINVTSVSGGSVPGIIPGLITSSSTYIGGSIGAPGKAGIDGKVTSTGGVTSSNFIPGVLTSGIGGSTSGTGSNGASGVSSSVTNVPTTGPTGPATTSSGAKTAGISGSTSGAPGTSAGQTSTSGVTNEKVSSGGSGPTSGTGANVSSEPGASGTGSGGLGSSGTSSGGTTSVPGTNVGGGSSSSDSRSSQQTSGNQADNKAKIGDSTQKKSDSLSAQTQRMDNIGRIVSDAIGKSSINEKDKVYRDGITNVQQESTGSASAGNELPFLRPIGSTDNLAGVGSEEFEIEENLDEGKLVLYITEKQLLQLLKQRAVIVPNKKKLLLDEKPDTKRVFLLDQTSDGSINETLVWQGPGTGPSQQTQHTTDQSYKQQNSSTQYSTNQVQTTTSTSGAGRTSPYRQVDVFVKTRDDQAVPLPNILSQDTYGQVNQANNFQDIKKRQDIAETKYGYQYTQQGGYTDPIPPSKIYTEVKQSILTPNELKTLQQTTGYTNDEKINQYLSTFSDYTQPNQTNTGTYTYYQTGPQTSSNTTSLKPAETVITSISGKDTSVTQPQQTFVDYTYYTQPSQTVVTTHETPSFTRTTSGGQTSVTTTSFQPGTSGGSISDSHVSTTQQVTVPSSSTVSQNLPISSRPAETVITSISGKDTSVTQPQQTFVDYTYYTQPSQTVVTTHETPSFTRTTSGGQTSVTTTSFQPGTSGGSISDSHVSTTQQVTVPSSSTVSQNLPISSRPAETVITSISGKDTSVIQPQQTFVDYTYYTQPSQTVVTTHETPSFTRTTSGGQTSVTTTSFQPGTSGGSISDSHVSTTQQVTVPSSSTVSQNLPISSRPAETVITSISGKDTSVTQPQQTFVDYTYYTQPSQTVVTTHETPSFTRTTSGGQTSVTTTSFQPGTSGGSISESHVSTTQQVTVPSSSTVSQNLPISSRPAETVITSILGKDTSVTQPQQTFVDYTYYTQPSQTVVTTHETPSFTRTTSGGQTSVTTTSFQPGTSGGSISDSHVSTTQQVTVPSSSTVSQNLPISSRPAETVITSISGKDTSVTQPQQTFVDYTYYTQPSQTVVTTHETPSFTRTTSGGQTSVTTTSFQPGTSGGSISDSHVSTTQQVTVPSSSTVSQNLPISSRPAETVITSISGKDTSVTQPQQTFVDYTYYTQPSQTVVTTHETPSFTRTTSGGQTSVTTTSFQPGTSGGSISDSHVSTTQQVTVPSSSTVSQNLPISSRPAETVITSILGKDTSVTQPQQTFVDYTYYTQPSQTVVTTHETPSFTRTTSGGQTSVTTTSFQPGTSGGSISDSHVSTTQQVTVPSSSTVSQNLPISSRPAETVITSISGKDTSVTQPQQTFVDYTNYTQPSQTVVTTHETPSFTRTTSGGQTSVTTTSFQPGTSGGSISDSHVSTTQQVTVPSSSTVSQNLPISSRPAETVITSISGKDTSVTQPQQTFVDYTYYTQPSQTVVTTHETPSFTRTTSGGQTSVTTTSFQPGTSGGSISDSHVSTTQQVTVPSSSTVSQNLPISSRPAETVITSILGKDTSVTQPQQTFVDYTYYTQPSQTVVTTHETPSFTRTTSGGQTSVTTTSFQPGTSGGSISDSHVSTTQQVTVPSSSTVSQNLPISSRPAETVITSISGKDTSVTQPQQTFVDYTYYTQPSQTVVTTHETPSFTRTTSGGQTSVTTTSFQPGTSGGSISDSHVSTTQQVTVPSSSTVSQNLPISSRPAETVITSISGKDTSVIQPQQTFVDYTYYTQPSQTVVTTHETPSFTRTTSGGQTSVTTTSFQPGTSGGSISDSHVSTTQQVTVPSSSTVSQNLPISSRPAETVITSISGKDTSVTQPQQTFVDYTYYTQPSQTVVTTHETPSFTRTTSGGQTSVTTTSFQPGTSGGSISESHVSTTQQVTVPSSSTVSQNLPISSRPAETVITSILGKDTSVTQPQQTFVDYTYYTQPSQTVVTTHETPSFTRTTSGGQTSVTTTSFQPGTSGGSISDSHVSTTQQVTVPSSSTVSQNLPISSRPAETVITSISGKDTSVTQPQQTFVDYTYYTQPSQTVVTTHETPSFTRTTSGGQTSVTTTSFQPGTSGGSISDSHVSTTQQVTVPSSSTVSQNLPISSRPAETVITSISGKDTSVTQPQQTFVDYTNYTQPSQTVVTTHETPSFTRTTSGGQTSVTTTSFQPGQTDFGSGFSAQTPQNFNVYGSGAISSGGDNLYQPSTYYYTPDNSGSYYQTVEPKTYESGQYQSSQHQGSYFPTTSATSYEAVDNGISNTYFQKGSPSRTNYGQSHKIFDEAVKKIDDQYNTINITPTKTDEILSTEKIQSVLDQYLTIVKDSTDPSDPKTIHWTTVAEKLGPNANMIPTLNNIVEQLKQDGSLPVIKTQHEVLSKDDIENKNFRVLEDVAKYIQAPDSSLSSVSVSVSRQSPPVKSASTSFLEAKKDDQNSVQSFISELEKLKENKDKWANVEINTQYEPEVKPAHERHELKHDTNGISKLSELVEQVKEGKSNIEQIVVEVKDPKTQNNVRYVIDKNDENIAEAFKNVIEKLKSDGLDSSSQINVDLVRAPGKFEQRKSIVLIDSSDKDANKKIDEIIQTLKTAEPNNKWLQAKAEVVQQVEKPGPLQTITLDFAKGDEESLKVFENLIEEIKANPTQYSKVDVEARTRVFETPGSVVISSTSAGNFGTTSVNVPSATTVVLTQPQWVPQQQYLYPSSTEAKTGGDNVLITPTTTVYQQQFPSGTSTITTNIIQDQPNVVTKTLPGTETSTIQTIVGGNVIPTTGPVNSTGNLYQYLYEPTQFSSGTITTTQPQTTVVEHGAQGGTFTSINNFIPNVVPGSTSNTTGAGDSQNLNQYFYQPTLQPSGTTTTTVITQPQSTTQTIVIQGQQSDNESLKPLDQFVSNVLGGSTTITTVPSTTTTTQGSNQTLNQYLYQPTQQPSGTSTTTVITQPQSTTQTVIIQDQQGEKEILKPLDQFASNVLGGSTVITTVPTATTTVIGQPQSTPLTFDIGSTTGNTTATTTTFITQPKSTTQTQVPIQGTQREDVTLKAIDYLVANKLSGSTSSAPVTSTGVNQNVYEYLYQPTQQPSGTTTTTVITQPQSTTQTVVIQGEQSDKENLKPLDQFVSNVLGGSTVITTVPAATTTTQGDNQNLYQYLYEPSGTTTTTTVITQPQTTTQTKVIQGASSDKENWKTLDNLVASILEGSTAVTTGTTTTVITQPSTTSDTVFGGSTTTVITQPQTTTQTTVIQGTQSEREKLNTLDNFVTNVLGGSTAITTGTTTTSITQPSSTSQTLVLDNVLGGSTTTLITQPQTTTQTTVIQGTQSEREKLNTLDNFVTNVLGGSTAITTGTTTTSITQPSSTTQTVVIQGSQSETEKLKTLDALVGTLLGGSTTSTGQTTTTTTTIITQPKTSTEQILIQGGKTEEEKVKILDSLISKITSSTTTDQTKQITQSGSQTTQQELESRRLLEEYRRRIKELENKPVNQPGIIRETKYIKVPVDKPGQVVTKHEKETSKIQPKANTKIKKTITYTYLDDYKPTTRVYTLEDKYIENQIKSRINEVPSYLNGVSLKDDTLSSLYAQFGKPSIKQLNEQTTIINTGLKSKDFVQIHPLLTDKTTINKTAANGTYGYAALPTVTEPVIIDSENYDKYSQEIAKHFGGLKVIDFPIYVQGLELRQGSNNSLNNSFVQTNLRKNASDNTTTQFTTQTAADADNVHYIRVNSAQQQSNMRTH